MLKIENVDYMPTPVTKQHLSRGGIHLNDKGQQKLTAAMAEVLTTMQQPLSLFIYQPS